MPLYSTIIRNAEIFDGSGSEPKRSDIGISGDKITRIGDLNSESAAMEIDASGLYAAPGFIDLTSHSDTHWTLFDRPSQESLLYQGVTTIMGGNCGSSLAPITKPSDAEDLGKWTDMSKMNINWQTVKEFLQELENLRSALNFGTLAGHGAVRRASGMDISLAATPDDIKKMAYLAKNAMRDGAYGISTGLGRGHSLAADDEELLRLFSEVKKVSGFTAHHLQDEGADAVGAVSRIAGLSRTSGVKSHISHFKVLGKQSWPKQKTALEIIERARAGGVEITLDFFPYTSTGSNLYLLLPDWAIAGSDSEILKRLSDPGLKQKIIESVGSLTLHYEKIIIASTLKDTGVAGKSLKIIAENAGLKPEEAILELLSENRLQVSIFNEVLSEENLYTLAGKNFAAISSDGAGLGLSGPKTNLPHPRSFGTFARAFKILVREKGILSWAEAVRKMTGLPSDIAGLNGRGLLKEGFFADVAVFDPANIGDEADYVNPRRFSKGMQWVFVNGAPALADGNPSARAGRILRKS